METTGFRRYARLANTPKQKYVLFTKVSWELIGACEVAKNPQIFLTRENKHIQEISKQFDGFLNHFGLMVFTENQEENQPYNL